MQRFLADYEGVYDIQKRFLYRQLTKFLEFLSWIDSEHAYDVKKCHRQVPRVGVFWHELTQNTLKMPKTYYALLGLGRQLTFFETQSLNWDHLLSF